MPPVAQKYNNKSTSYPGWLRVPLEGETMVSRISVCVFTQTDMKYCLDMGIQFSDIGVSFLGTASRTA